MNIENFYEYCLAKKGVTEHFPFDEDTLVFKVGGKMFALSSLIDWESGKPSVNLKCNPERAITLREEHGAIQPGYHMNKQHWNTVLVNKDAGDALVCELIDHSYELIFKSLPKTLQAQIAAGNN